MDYSEEENKYSNYYDNHEETADSSKEIDYHKETADSSKEKDIIDDTETRLVKNAIYYLTHKTYPIGAAKNEKRSIRRRGEKWGSKARQILGMLFHIGVFFLKVSNTLVFVY